MTNEFINVAREDFVQLLGENVMTFEFEKLDGTMRKMIATRVSSKIPVDQMPANGVTDVEGAVGNVAVFDLEVCGWRSVNPAKLVSMGVANG